MKKSQITTILVLIFIVAVILIIQSRFNAGGNKASNSTTTAATSSENAVPTYPLGSTITMELKKPVMVASTTISINAVLSDSRCASDVQCITAGRVVVMINMEGPGGSSVDQIEEGKTVTSGNLAITLDKVDPYPISTKKITDDEYRFRVSVRAK
jgi:hypothetical protein